MLHMYLFLQVYRSLSKLFCGDENTREAATDGNWEEDDNRRPSCNIYCYKLVVEAGDKQTR